jgi:hypothetical protein
MEPGGTRFFNFSRDYVLLPGVVLIGVRNPLFMQQADTNSGPAPLPLFRAEAMAARQQNAQGEILLIRPFSLVFLCWLGIAVAAAALGFLLFGHITLSRRIEGTIITTSTAPDPTSQQMAVFKVRRSQLQALQPGRDLLIQCAACAYPLTGKIIDISKSSAPLSPGSHDLYSKVTVALPPEEQLQPGARVEAQIRSGRKSLLAWLLEKPES